MNNEAPSIFRKKALARLSSPEELDKLLYVVKPKSSIVLFTSIALVILVLLWAIFGKISTVAVGEGIYLDLSKMHSITVPVSGRVIQIPVDIGEHIEKNQIVAILFDEDQKKETEIRSPYEGIIVDMQIEKGAVISLNEVILNIQKHETPASTNDRFYCFLPAKEGDKIQKDMEARIYPWGIEKSVYGGIIGKVAKISYLPATDYYFKSIFLNESFARHLTENNPLIPFVIDPVESKNNPAEFTWTSQHGPKKEEIPLGSFVTTQVIVETRSPISYVLPFWFFKKFKKDSS